MQRVQRPSVQRLCVIGVVHGGAVGVLEREMRDFRVSADPSALTDDRVRSRAKSVRLRKPIDDPFRDLASKGEIAIAMRDLGLDEVDYWRRERRRSANCRRE